MLMARRGSSTRKHKVSLQEGRPQVKAEKRQKLDKRFNVIKQLELEIKQGRKGNPLNETEINKLKVRIANLEHQLGIKHD